MKKVLAILAVLAIVASPVFAAVQNVKVSGDIDSTYVNRSNFALGNKSAIGLAKQGLVDQSDFLTQTRLRVDADLSDNVSTTVGLINERAWDAEGSSDTNVQLYLANVTLREFLYSPLTLTVGRQALNYGNGLVFGDGGANNVATGNLATVAADLTKRTTWDGIKAVLDYKPLTLDLLYVRNSANATNGGTLLASTNAAKDNDDVYGVNANYQLGDASNTVVEGYFFSRRNSSGSIFTGSSKADTIYLPGLRVSTNPVKGLNVGGEFAWQTGNKAQTAGTSDNIRRNAMAAQFLSSYEVPVLEKYKPVASASYTYVSGDKNGSVARSIGGNNPKSEETYTAWDPFFEAQAGGTIYNTLFDLTNMHIFNAGLKVNPMEDVTAKASWSSLYAVKRYKAGENPLALRQPDRTATLSPTTTGRKDIGNEYDLGVDYAYTEDVTFGLSLGWFVPGATFTGANDSVASQALAHVLVNF